MTLWEFCVIAFTIMSTKSSDKKEVKRENKQVRKKRTKERGENKDIKKEKKLEFFNTGKNKKTKPKTGKQLQNGNTLKVGK